jgi:Gas vesicle synthesis protein GvpL/GvpF
MSKTGPAALIKPSFRFSVRLKFFHRTRLLQGFTMYTYAILRPTAGLALPPGMVGKTTVLGAGELWALVEPTVHVATIRQDDTQLVAAAITHDRVLREVFGQTTLLPLQFGTEFRSAAKLLQHLNAHQAHYLERLRHLTGKVEHMLKWIAIEPPDDLPDHLPDHLPTAAYRQQQQAELDALLVTLAQTYADIVPGVDGDRLYFCVDRVADLPALLPVWQARCLHWQLNLTEPLPPYHFVNFIL